MKNQNSAEDFPRTKFIALHLQVLLIAVKAMKSSIKPSNTLMAQLEKASTWNLKEHVMHLLSPLYTHSRICHLHFLELCWKMGASVFDVWRRIKCLNSKSFKITCIHGYITLLQITIHVSVLHFFV